MVLLYRTKNKCQVFLKILKKLSEARGYDSPPSASARAPQAHGVEIHMNPQHKEIRAKLQSMAPRRAVAYIAALELPSDEAFCIIECDVRKKSRQQVADCLFSSEEYVKRCRRRGYRKIADAVKFS